MYMQMRRYLYIPLILILFLAGCMEHIDLPPTIITPTPLSEEYIYGTEEKVSYALLWDTVKDGVEVFGSPYLYRDVVGECLFKDEGAQGLSKKLSRVDGPFSFVIEGEHTEREREVVEKIIRDVLPKGYGTPFTPSLKREDSTLFTISFVSPYDQMADILSAYNIYGLYITGREEKNIIKSGAIFVRDLEFLRSTHPDMGEDKILTIMEAILCEEMAQAPIEGQDNTIDEDMRFYENPKIEDYLEKPDLTEKDFAILKIALLLPPGTDNKQWRRFMNKYIEERR